MYISKADLNWLCECSKPEGKRWLAGGNHRDEVSASKFSTAYDASA